MKVLFIGNSATYVHEIPQTLERLASNAGFDLECKMLAKGGFELFQHADATTEHGQKVLTEIAQGFDIVFLQDNGNCITTEEKRQNTKSACKTLVDAIRKSNALPYFYIRPPYGKDLAGLNSFEQCIRFDELFEEIAIRLEIKSAYANRAFAYAIRNLDYPLWGPDHAHTSPHGAYLIVCVLFATLFGRSATLLGPSDLPTADALALQKVADRIALDGMIPW